MTAGTKSPSKSDVLLTRSQINDLEKGRNQLASDVQFTESIVSINLGRSGLVLVTESRVKRHINIQTNSKKFPLSSSTLSVEICERNLLSKPNSK